MSTKERQNRSVSVTTAHLSELLDEALEETFPASDPVAIHIETESSRHGTAVTASYRAAVGAVR